LSGDDGIDNDGSFNFIVNNNITNTKYEDGITTRGVNNVIQGNYIYNSGKDGIDVRLDEDPETKQLAFPLRGCCHDILDNTVIKTVARGIRVRVNSTAIKGNTVEEAGEQGIRLNNDDDSNFPELGNLNVGNDCKVVDNVVKMGMERGIEVEGTGNLIKNNIVTDNGEEGIIIEVEGNRVYKNVVNGNGAADFEDASGGCDGNDYKENTGGTANFECILA